MNVLAIEPDSRLGQLLAADLARHGHTARVASGAREALDAGPDFDLILLELDLPDADGFDVLAQLRGLTQTPIVALTRRASLADRVRGLSEGADDYLAKPYALPELLARPALEALSGSDWQPQRIPAVLGGDFAKPSPVRRFLRATLRGGTAFIGNSHASGSLLSMIGSNCLIDVPAGSPPLHAGDPVTAWLM